MSGHGRKGPTAGGIPRFMRRQVDAPMAELPEADWIASVSGKGGAVPGALERGGSAAVSLGFVERVAQVASGRGDPSGCAAYTSGLVTDRAADGAVLGRHDRTRQLRRGAGVP